MKWSTLVVRLATILLFKVKVVTIVHIVRLVVDYNTTSLLRFGVQKYDRLIGTFKLEIIYRY